MQRFYGSLAFGFAAANLFVLRSWKEVDDLYDPVLSIFARAAPDRNVEQSVGALAALLTLAFTLLFWLRDRPGRPVSKSVFKFITAGLSLVLLIQLERFILSSEGVSIIVVGPFLILLNFALAGAVYRGHAQLSVVLDVFLLICLPFSLLQLAQAVNPYRSAPIAEDHVVVNMSAYKEHQPLRPRIIWMIFDELDQTLTFDERPERISLPEIDRLRGESIYASAVTPVSDVTLLAIAAMTSGAVIRDVLPTDNYDLELRFVDDRPSKPWGRHPNIFNTARIQGRNPAVAGWHIPYCRVFEDDLGACHWEQLPGISDSHEWSEFIVSIDFGRAIYEQFVRNLSRFCDLGGEWASGFVRQRQRRESVNAARRNQLSSFLALRQVAIRYLSDTKFDFIFIHVPIPHPFGIYDSRNDSYSASDEVNYVDNLRLVDRFLFDVREALNDRAEWDQAMIIVTSDHSLRPSLWREYPTWGAEMETVAATSRLGYVPLLIKMPGQNDGIEYQRAFNLLALYELLAAVLRQDVKSETDVVDWLDEHARSIGELPYGFGEPPEN